MTNRSLKSYYKNHEASLVRNRKYKSSHKKQLDDYNKIYRTSASRKFVHLKHRSKYKNFKFDIKRDDFLEWFNNQTKTCHYCGIKIECCHKNKRQRLSFDRKNNNLSYTLDNMVLSCYGCNAIKSDYINYETMIEIGKLIRKQRESEINNT